MVFIPRSFRTFAISSTLSSPLAIPCAPVNIAVKSPGSMPSKSTPFSEDGLNVSVSAKFGINTTGLFFEDLRRIPSTISLDNPIQASEKLYAHHSKILIGTVKRGFLTPRAIGTSGQRSQTSKTNFLRGFTIFEKIPASAMEMGVLDAKSRSYFCLHTSGRLRIENSAKASERLYNPILLEYGTS